MSPACEFALRTLATLLLAAIAWVLLGYLATAPLGALFGWSGHPSMPAAPITVYVVLYLFVLPLSSLGIAWWIVWRLAQRRAGRVR